MIKFTGTLECGFLGSYTINGVLTNDNELYVVSLAGKNDALTDDIIIQVNCFLSMGITDKERKDIITKLNDPDKAKVVNLSMHHHCSIY